MRVLPVLLFLIASVAECLMLSRVLVPQYKLYGQDAILKCDYDLGRDRLYAVKWYKDNEEFFRYVPRFNPPIYTHPVEGVRVDSTKSNDKRIQLRSLTVRSSGGYRCEVSAEAPSFSSIMGEGRMTVVYLPKDPPQITGQVRQEYEVGNVLDLNCTSAKSFPPAKLSWYINDSPVHVPPGSISIYPAAAPPQPDPTSLVGGYQQQRQQYYPPAPTPTPTAAHILASSLMISSLRLQLQLESHHFGPKGNATVRCVARISPLFWQDGDEKILSGNQHGSRVRHGRKKVAESGELEEEQEEDDNPEREESHLNKPAHSSNNYNNKFRGHQQQQHHNSQQKENQVQYRHQNHNHQGNYRHGMGGGRNEERGGNSEEGDDDEEEEDEYYGLGLPSFQKEALVFVRGSCSRLKPGDVIQHLAIALLGGYNLYRYL